jgi:hypothetical protein
VQIPQFSPCQNTYSTDFNSHIKVIIFNQLFI